ncbi:hypothetical protein [Paeniglutamicibacter cryotolerans]|uniref:Uncharacterized protein n=1 Tax=Paeniglutamicibacter cryotolerans TaxID=670079 RepID=A0A839QQK6_9MICC|nr:hypothetical protein [Paeniglutamicibacter cryotolerans]MBB2996925.1 hypothetical protein [Paeniglutamicibacter cryotolerans]
MSTMNGRPRTPASPTDASLCSIARAGLWFQLLLGGIVVFVLVVALLAKDPFALWSLLPTTAIMVLAGWWFGSGRIVVDEAGVRVYGGGVLKMLEVKTADIASAEAKEISPLEYGGWGLRISGAGTAFILKRGPGLVVNRTKGAPRIYSVASTSDAELMAARLNALAARSAPSAK